MVEYQKKASSGVAKAALATAIGGTALGLLNGGGALSPLRNAFAPAAAYVPGFAAPAAFASSYMPVDPACGCYVTEKEMCLIRENAGKDATIGRLEAEKYADNKIALSLIPVYGELSKQKDEICALQKDLAMETERRACGDERLLTYVDGSFIRASKRLDSRHIDYHGVRPVVETTHHRDRHDCHDHHDGHDGCGCR